MDKTKKAEQQATKKKKTFLNIVWKKNSDFNFNEAYPNKNRNTHTQNLLGSGIDAYVGLKKHTHKKKCTFHLTKINDCDEIQC